MRGGGGVGGVGVKKGGVFNFIYGDMIFILTNFIVDICL